MLARRALQLGAALVAAAVVLSVLSALEVGLSEPPPEAEDVSQQIINNFETAEEEYLSWGRWIDLATALAFAALLVAVPFLPQADRAKYTLVPGVTLAIAGELIDLSKLTAFEVGRFALTNDLPADFAGANVFRFAINTTSTYAWVSGLVLLAVGLLVLAFDAEERNWGRASAWLAAAIAAVAATVLWASSQVFLISTLILAVLTLYWIVIAIRRMQSPT
ncbi:MAG: hypothetical protein ACT4OP_10585 [Actinomycetota bacterium]